MKNITLSILLVIAGILSTNAQAVDQAHIPAKGSAERQAILDALREKPGDKFLVNYIKVHNGWAWVDTTPIDAKGQPTAEGGPNLVHLVNGKWKVEDLSRVLEDKNDPLGPEDASPTYIRNLRRVFKGCPADIFPKPGN